MMKKKIFYGWIIVFSCMLLTAGSTGLLSYLSALFVEPVTADLGFGRTEFTVYSTFTTVTSMLVMPIIGDIYKRFPTKLLILFGACCGAGAMILFAFSSRLLSFYIGAVFAGIGITFCGGMPVAILLNNWFNEKRGLVTGIAFTGPGIVSAALSPVISRIIASWGWRYAYLTIGIAILVLLVPTTLFLIRLTPADMGLNPYGITAERPKAEDDNIGFTRAEAVKMLAFWLFALSLLLVGIITYGTQQHMVAFWTENGAGAETAASTYSIVMLIAAFAKIAIGGVFDRYSARNASVLCGFVAFGAMVSLNFCTGGISILIPALLFGITATLQVMLPTYLTGKLFGQKDYGSLYGLFSSVLFLGAGAGIPLSSAIYDLTGRYTAAWILYAVLAVVLTITIVCADYFSKKLFQKNTQLKGSVDMIFYFSGTGNSEGLAKMIAQRLGDKAVSIVDQNPVEYLFDANDYLGFVFPVYAYAAPEMMIEFAKQINPGDAFTFAVCTFSNVTGDALEHFSDYLPLKSGYGIKMPDNFPVLDKILETEESALQKLRAAEIRLEEVFPRIAAKEIGVFDTLRGENGHELSYKGYPLFNESMRKTAPYWVEKDKCVGCGLCAKLCPAHAIAMQNGYPVWVKEDCSMCMSCLNRCPKEAVEFGKFSKGKFRYFFKGFDTSKYFTKK